MAKVAAASTRIYVDEFNFSGFLNAAEFSVKQELADVTGFVNDLSDATQLGPRRLPGNYDHSLSHAGFFDPADDSFDEQVFAMLDSADDHYVAQLFAGGTEGNPCYESVVRFTDQPRKAQVGQAILLDLAGEGSNGVTRATILRNATIAANGNGTGRNIGASTSGQTFQVVIRVISGTFTSFDVNIDESQNDGAPDAYANVAGLSQTGINAAGVWRKTVTTATEAWKRVSIANWIGTDAVLVVTAGIVAGT